MNIINRIKSAFSFIVILIIISSCTDNEIMEKETDKRPNFIFLFSDDQTYRSVNAINNPEIITPNIDKLAESGIVFTHCFNQGSWSGAVCVPSRAMLN